MIVRGVQISSCRPTVPASSTAASPAWCANGPASVPFTQRVVRQHSDRRQSQRPGAARRVFPARRARARAIAFERRVAGSRHAATKPVREHDPRGHRSAGACRRAHRRFDQRAGAAHQDARARGQAVERRGSRRRQEAAGRARCRRPRRVHRIQAHAGRLPRPGRPEDLAAAGRRAVERRGPQGAAHGLSALRARRHRQDVPGRVPGR